MTPDAFKYSYHKLLDCGTSICCQVDPIRVKLVQTFPVGSNIASYNLLKTEIGITFAPVNFAPYAYIKSSSVTFVSSGSYVLWCMLVTFISVVFCIALIGGLIGGKL